MFCTKRKEKKVIAIKAIWLIATTWIMLSAWECNGKVLSVRVEGWNQRSMRWNNQKLGAQKTAPDGRPIKARRIA
jgi:hypothetical protein